MISKKTKTTNARGLPKSKSCCPRTRPIRKPLNRFDSKKVFRQFYLISKAIAEKSVWPWLKRGDEDFSKREELLLSEGYKVRYGIIRLYCSLYLSRSGSPRGPPLRSMPTSGNCASPPIQRRIRAQTARTRPTRRRPTMPRMMLRRTTRYKRAHSSSRAAFKTNTPATAILTNSGTFLHLFNSHFSRSVTLIQ